MLNRWSIFFYPVTKMDSSIMVTTSIHSSAIKLKNGASKSWFICNSSTYTPINNCHKWKCASNAIEVKIFCVFLKLILLESMFCILNNYHLHISWQVHLINSSAELNLIQVLPPSLFFKKLDLLPLNLFLEYSLLIVSHICYRNSEPKVRNNISCKWKVWQH